MKFIKIFAVIILSLIFATVIFLYYPYDITPPMPALTVNGEEIPYVTGSYTWDITWIIFSRGRCVNSIPFSVILEDTDPIIVQPLSTLKIQFKKKPTEIFLYQMEGHNVIQEETLENNTVILPENPGVYMFELRAKWKTGRDASYGFLVEVV